MSFSPYNSPIDPGFYSTLALFLMVAGLASSAVFIVKQVWSSWHTLVIFWKTPRTISALMWTGEVSPPEWKSSDFDESFRVAPTRGHFSHIFDDLFRSQHPNLAELWQMMQQWQQFLQSWWVSEWCSPCSLSAFTFELATATQPTHRSSL